MTRRYTSEIINEIGPERDIPAPDVGTNAKVMAWIFDTYSMNKGHSVLGVVTGKPLELGGSLGRVEATARGGLYCLREALRKRGTRMDDVTVAVQGFGNVGSYLARFMAELGATVVAVSDSAGGIYNERGIDVAAAVAHKQETGSLEGWRGGEALTNEELVLVSCDVLAPCALEQVITTENADAIKAQVIIEGANGPTTPAADEILEDAGHPRPPRRPRQRGRRRGLLLRVGAGPPGVLLEGGRGEREAQRHRHARVQRDLGALRGARHQHAPGRVRPGRAARRRGDHHPRSVPIAPSPEVVLYTAAGCHLCDDARAVLDALAGELGFTFDEVEISGDDELEGALPRAHPGRRAGRPPGVRLLRPAGCLPRRLRGRTSTALRRGFVTYPPP